MIARSLRIGLVMAGPALLAVSCSREEPARSETPSRIKQAKGRVTLLDGTSTPEVVPLAPPIVVKAPRFLPLGSGGNNGAMAHMRTWTTGDGLPMDDITCGHLDANGMLWFGTNGGGITRYDGRSFTNYTMAHGLPDNVILSLGGDSKGNVWIGTSTGGLCRYDGRVFTTFVIGGATGLARGITCMLEDPGGTMWFGSRGRGLHRYAGQRFTTLTRKDGLAGNFVRGIARTEDGDLWLSTLNGISRYDGKRFVNYAEANGRSLTDVEWLVRGSGNELWLGHTSGGITHCVVGDGGTLFTHYPVIVGEQVRVNHLHSDGHGALWIATVSHGVIRMEPHESEEAAITRFTTAQGLASDEVLCITADRHGDLWFGTRGAGVSHYRGSAFTNFRNVKPVSIAEDGAGAIWMGTDGGLVRFDGTSFTEQQLNAERDRWIYSVSVDPQGHIGFGVNMSDTRHHGMSWFDGTNYHVISASDDRDWTDVFWTMHDRSGRLWAGGRRGVERYDNAQPAYRTGRRTTFTTTQGLGHNTVLCLREARDGAVWAGTDGGGVSRIDSGSITTWTTAEGLPNNAVWSIGEDAGGALWIATLGGLSRYDGKSFLTFTTQDGLPDDNINQVFVSRSKEGGLLIGTLNGLAILTGWKNAKGNMLPFAGELSGVPNSAIEGYTPVFEIYNSATGFPVKDVQTAEHALFEDSKGIIWISTGSDKTGLVRFDRKALRTDPEPLTVQLLSVSVNNERVCWYDLGDAQQDSATIAQHEVRTFGRPLTSNERRQVRSAGSGVTFTGIAKHFPIPEGLVLPYRNNRVGFEFVGVETARPEVVEYQYMLEGYDEGWSPVARTTNAGYGNIHEGDYTFKVKAKNPNGVWSAPVEFRFTVLPPWQRTWWAYALYVLAIGGCVLFYIRLRIAGLRKQQRKLVRLVTKRTEELRRKKEEADVQRGRAELSEKAKEQFLANMSHEIRTPMNAIMGMTGILQRNAHPAEQDRYLSAIKQSSENLLVILNDILDMSKIDAGRIDLEEVPFEPRKVMDNVKEILQFKVDEKKLSMVTEVATEVPLSLIGDPTRLHQVVLNLAGNAIKFTERGSVTIRVHRSVDPLRSPKPGEGEPGRPDRIALVIDVIDTGIGIPQDRQDKIFEEFTQAYSDTTRKYGGTGLGLTISKRLVELQGGSITVKSERDKGSTFTVTIPYAIASASSDRAIPARGRDDKSVELRDLRILLAEDNEFNVMVALDELTDAIPGVQVDVAINGRIAVEMAQANTYHAILMDVQMPEMSGYEATRAIRALPGAVSGIPIIAMTANVMEAELDLCRKAGMTGYIPKPFTRANLMGSIRAALGTA